MTKFQTPLFEKLLDIESLEIGICLGQLGQLEQLE